MSLAKVSHMTKPRVSEGGNFATVWRLVICGTISVAICTFSWSNVTMHGKLFLKCCISVSFVWYVCTCSGRWGEDIVPENFNRY